MNEEFALAPGQTATVSGTSVRLTFERVSEDSRCPTDVTCIWEGDAVVVLKVKAEADEATREVHTQGGESRSRKAPRRRLRGDAGPAGPRAALHRRHRAVGVPGDPERRPRLTPPRRFLDGRGGASLESRPPCLPARRRRDARALRPAAGSAGCSACSPSWPS